MIVSCRRFVLSLVAVLALALPSGGCATIVGTLFSPITGGVDLVRLNVDRDEWYLVLPVFIGGMIAGPFVALYNGVNHDVTVFKNFRVYWKEFDQVFRPFEMLDRQH